nr:hypothetical protein [Tenacibaculum maritimum]
MTKEHINDRNLLKNSHFHDKVFGKPYVDQGYLNKELFDELFADAIHIEKIGKRAMIAPVNDILKNTYQIKHAKHCSSNHI